MTTKTYTSWDQDYINAICEEADRLARVEEVLKRRLKTSPKREVLQCPSGLIWTSGRRLSK